MAAGFGTQIGLYVYLRQIIHTTKLASVLFFTAATLAGQYNEVARFGGAVLRVSR